MIRSRFFRSVFEQSNVPQMLASLDFTTTIQNKAFYTFLGYTAEEWEGMKLSDVSYPEDQEIDSQLTLELIRGLRSYYQIEKRYYHKSGMLLLGTLNVTLISDPEAGSRYLLIQIIDITEKYLMDESLRKNEKQYRILAEHSSDMIMLHDVNGIYKYISPSFKTILGYEPTQKLGTNPYDIIHPDDREMVRKHHQKVVNNQILQLVSYRVRKSDGTYLWIETNIKGVLDEETGELTELISVSRDIQQRMETDELLRKSEKLAVVGRMAAAVAHEIRNPLTPIKGFISLISKTKEYNPMFIEVILNELKRIETIITEFLSMAKPSNQKMTLLPLDRTVKQVVSLMEAEAMMANKVITVDLEDDPEIMGDESSLKQVLFHVIQNALESMDHNGIVKITLYTVDNHAYIKIVDNGCGMSRERLAQIGEPFYSTKEKGTGLGLMTCFNIIEKHQGKLEIESEEGKGTVVKMGLPLIIKANTR